MFTEVLAYALKGCGSSLSKLKASARFKAVLAEQRALPEKYGASSRKALVLSKGTRAFGMLHHQPRSFNWKRFSEEPDEEFRPEERALIQCFSEELFKSAKAALPRKARQLAKKWRTADTRQRLEIARAFLELFPASEGNCFVDELTQTPDKVLPGKFDLYAADARKPNCVGRMLLAAAFFELCGAKTYSVVVLSTADREWDRAYVKHIDQIRSSLRSSKSYCARKFTSALRRSQQHAAERIAQPTWLHGAVKVQLNKKQFLIFDATHRRIVVTGFAQSGREKLAELYKFREVAPGVTLSFQNDSTRNYAKLMQRHLRRFARELQRFTAQVPKGSCDMERGYNALYHSQLPYLLLAAMGLESASITSDPTAQYLIRKKYDHKAPLTAALRHHLVRCCLSVILSDKTTWFADTGREKLDTLLTKQELIDLPVRYRREVLRRIPAFAASGVLEVSKREWRVMRNRVSHRNFEVGDTRWQIACAVLGHVAVTTDNWQETEAVLARHCFSQFRLFHHALILRDHFCTDALRSAECLKRKRGLLNSVRQVLPRLARKHGIILWKGEQNSVQRNPTKSVRRGNLASAKSARCRQDAR